MPNNNGTSVIGRVQQEALATAANLEQTAAGLRQFEQPLKACLTHTLAAMGHSHQSDVPALEGVVNAAIKTIGGCADSVAAGAKRVRDIEQRT
jgi:hypothetical protein